MNESSGCDEAPRTLLLRASRLVMKTGMPMPHFSCTRTCTSAYSSSCRARSVSAREHQQLIELLIVPAGLVPWAGGLEELGAQHVAARKVTFWQSIGRENVGHRINPVAKTSWSGSPFHTAITSQSCATIVWFMAVRETETMVFGGLISTAYFRHGAPGQAVLNAILQASSPSKRCPGPGTKHKNLNLLRTMIWCPTLIWVPAQSVINLNSRQTDGPYQHI